MILLSVQTYGQQKQILGHVIDQKTGMNIPYVSAIYRGNHVMVSGNADGIFVIDRHNGWRLTVSAVGYDKYAINVDEDTPDELFIELKPTTEHLDEVVVKTKKKKYSRKDNPAVELMKRVIAAKKKTDLANYDFYQYDRYQKITTSLNKLTPKDLESGVFKRVKFLKEYVEVNPVNNETTLPLIVNEKVTHQVYRKNPKSEKTIILGDNSTGLTQLFETGGFFTGIVQDAITDIDIYDDQVRLFQFPFTSPIGKDAIAFYRYYIIDTVKVDNDSCFHLQFLPNNQQDIGFRGEIYILKDSTLHVRRCNLTLPKQSDINWVDNMQMTLEYSKLDNGEWVLTVNDMIVELSITNFMAKGLIVKTTRLSNYDFNEIPKNLFRGKAKEKRDINADNQSESFWNSYRAVSLTKGESGAASLIKRLEQMKGWKYIIYGLKLLFENYAEVGSPPIFDLGPVNTFLTSNKYDGFRTRFGGMTNANLSKHWFFNGYYAHAWKSKNNYYLGELIYSFNEKDYLPREFPMRNIRFSSSYDVMTPSDKFLPTDKDNLFSSFKWAKIDKMILYNRQQLTLEREEDGGLRTTVTFKTESNEAVGNHHYYSLKEVNDMGGFTTNEGEWNHNGKIRFTEAKAEFRFSPGETYVYTKIRRRKINYDAPVITLSHAVGIKGLLGGQYNYNLTRFDIYKRFWLNSWGHVDCYFKSGILWDKVPYPLLIFPNANISYISQQEMFDLINNMEFANDRFLSVDLSWQLNGKIFNRIPLLKKLKLREKVGARMLWGGLSSKNNPTLFQNRNDDILMPLPNGTYIMDTQKPYFEIVVGVHNILKFINIEYVRRLNYLNLPTAHEHGIRFFIEPTF